MHGHRVPCATLNWRCPASRTKPTAHSFLSPLPSHALTRALARLYCRCCSDSVRRAAPLCLSPTRSPLGRLKIPYEFDCRTIHLPAKSNPTLWSEGAVSEYVPSQVNTFPAKRQVLRQITRRYIANCRRINRTQFALWFSGSAIPTKRLTTLLLMERISCNDFGSNTVSCEKHSPTILSRPKK